MTIPKTPTTPAEEQRKAINHERRERERLLWLQEHPHVRPKDYRRTRDAEACRARLEASVAAERAAWEMSPPGIAYPTQYMGRAMLPRLHEYFLRWQRAYTRQLLAARASATEPKAPSQRGRRR